MKNETVTQIATESSPDLNFLFQSSGEVLPDPEPKLKRKKANIVTEEVCLSARIGLSSRKAFHFLKATVKGQNGDVNDLSHSTFHREREKVREKVALEIQNNLPVEKVATLHWDEKCSQD